jgi:predicted MFS family arabinose efflux permease
MKINNYYKILVLAYGLSTFSEGILLPIYAIFVQKVGGGILDAAGAVATCFIIQGIVEIIIHKSVWSHKNRMKLIITGWLLWLIGISLYLFIQSILILFVTQILIGLGNARANPAFDAELSDKSDKSISEYEYGVFEGLQDIFQGIAAILGGLVVTKYGFGALINIMIGTAIISFILILNYMALKRKSSELII